VKLLLFGWTFALYYHLANGLRHLYWDTGNGFDLETVYLSGKIVVGMAAILTVLTWIIA
jgi:succinate dehydrogenase / fumarate reductase cytochrome b subunit